MEGDDDVCVAHINLLYEFINFLMIQITKKPLKSILIL
jgi:hypothetical protein